MPWRHIVVASLCGALLVGSTPSASAGAGADTGTPLTLIIVEGLNSSSETHGELFRHLVGATEQLLPETQVISFSYAGTDAYSACDTHQALELTATRLGELIGEERTLRPERRVAVVGHSLGGMVAISWLASAAQAGASSADLPSSVVAIDSPLRGMVREEAAFGLQHDLAPGCKDEALTQLVDLQRQPSSSLADGIAAAAQRGTLVVMVANQSDAVFTCCGGLTIEQTQFLVAPGTLALRYPSIPIDLPGLDDSPASSHAAALFNSDVVTGLASAIVSHE